MGTKICSKCKEEKEVCEFYKHSKNPNIYRGQCKKCMNEYSLNYKKNNIENINKKNKEYFEKNRELNKIKCIKYRNNNLEKSRERYKKWRLNNKEKINSYNQIPIIRLKNSLRNRINELMNKKYNNPRTIDLVGCDYEFLINYIEKKFTEGMSWNNYGYYGWHLDHIIPLSSAKTEEEMCKLCHYTNLQPLWAEDNFKKSNKIL
jgi:hypothetical protein